MSNETMKYRISLLLVLMIVYIDFQSSIALRFDDNGDDRFLFSNDETRARIIMIDGNMYFHAGKRHNITFITNDGGSVFFGQLNIENLPELVTDNDYIFNSIVCRAM
jgi:hypothetical protein